MVFGQLRLACLEGDGDEGIQGRGHVRRELVYVGRQKVDLQRHHPHSHRKFGRGGVGGGGWGEGGKTTSGIYVRFCEYISLYV